jgi:hypothetical protein
MSSLKAVPRSKLETQEAELSAAIASVAACIEAIKAELQERLRDPIRQQEQLSAQLSAIRNELEDRRRRDAITPTITDHALLRYIERVHGIDVEAMKSALLSDTVVLAIKNGAASVKTDECKLVIQGMAVVTVYPVEKTKAKKPTRAQRESMEIDDEYAV